MNEEQDEILSDSSPEANEQSTSESSQAEPSESTAAPETVAKTEDNVPFHLHPRFQEVISEKNELRNQTQALAKQLQELQSQLKASQPAQKDELMERLKGIDPAFAERIGKLSEIDQLKQQLQEFNQWREQSSAQSVQQQVSSVKSQFYTENKIPEDRKAIYEAMVQAEASRNPKLQISDLPKVMKQVHESLGKMFQTVERSTAKSFADGKKAEAAKPSSLPKGAPAKAGKTENANVSASDLRASMIKEALASVRADKEI